MIVKTDKYQCFLEKEGYSRDQGIPFTYVSYTDATDSITFLDEETYFQETDHLIEDNEATGNYELAEKIRKWVEAGMP